MKRVIATALIAISTSLAMTSCDTPECVDGHTTTALMPVFTGKTTTLIPQTRYICDVYEGEEQ